MESLEPLAGDAKRMLTPAPARRKFGTDCVERTRNSSRTSKLAVREEFSRSSVRVH